MGTTSDQSAKGTLLILDADPLPDLAAAVEDAGYIPCTVTNFAEFLLLLPSMWGLAAAVIDHDSTGEARQEIIKRLRSTHPAAPIVGTGLPEARSAFAVLGVEAFLSKPFTLAELLAYLG